MQRRSHDSVSSSDFRAYSKLASPGVHSSRAIMMSPPIILWVSTLFSGVNVCLEPSICEENVHPSGVSFLMGERENTWNPPLSVSIGRSHEMNLWRPPAAFSMSRPGLR